MRGHTPRNTYCRTCRRRHVVRSYEVGRGYGAQRFFTVHCRKRGVSYVPQRSIVTLNWLPI